MDECKGIYFLLDAFSEVIKQYNNVRLLIIGDGNINKCFEYCKDIWSKVTFTGFIQKEQLINFYQIADLGIVPSIYDHCPYSILEMISFKIPLILSNIEGLNEMLDESQCLFLNPEILENGDILFTKKMISEAILSFLQNENYSKNLANNAYKVIDNKFSAQKMAKFMVDAFYQTKSEYSTITLVPNTEC